MRKIFLIAKREFIATVATRAFVIGLLILPAMIGLFALIGPHLFNPDDFQLKGELAVIDPTGQVLPELRDIYDPEKIVARRKAEAARALETMPQQVRQLADVAAADDLGVDLLPIPELHVLELPRTADIEQEKTWLRVQPKEMPHLALVVIHPDAVMPAGGGGQFGTYDFYVPPNLGDEARGDIQQGLKDAIINARLNTRSVDGDALRSIFEVPPVRSVTITEKDQRQTVKGFNFFIPMIFGFLLFGGVMGAGGQLLTTMVEEKSSRVVEILLSAVSPIELMAGKLLGQMAVSMIGLFLYVGIGIVALVSFALMGLIDLSLIVYLFIFFILTYLVIGSLMMAVGAAVNEMKEAQGLMAPLTIAFMLPWLLWFPITRNPDSVLSLVMSFLPPVNTFAIILRMASSSPPPWWQVWLSILIGIGSVLGAIWFTSKVFRIGLLMYGKPPNFRTLIRWVRSA
ncbi:MAG: ABC transporter permease [Acidobacteriota bacterium]